MFKFFPLPNSVIGIIEAGGLFEYTKKKLTSSRGETFLRSTVYPGRATALIDIAIFLCYTILMLVSREMAKE